MIKKSLPLLLLLGVLGTPLLFQVVPLEIIKLKVFDAYVPEKEPSGYFSILNITEEDIAREGGYPLPRQRLAEIQMDLLNHGAIGVGWVMAFPQPDRLGGDPHLQRHWLTPPPSWRCLKTIAEIIHRPQARSSWEKTVEE